MRLLRTTLAALALVAVATLSTAQPPTYTTPGVAGDATHSSAARDPVDASDPCSNTGRDRWINTVTGAEWYCKDHTIDDWAQVSPGGAGGGTGDVTGGANLSNNYDVFKTENPTTHVLEFRSLIAGTNLTMAENAIDITINASGQPNTCYNEGAGQGQLCMPKVGVNLPIRTLKQSTNVTLVTEGDNSVRIDAAAGSASLVQLGTTGMRVYKGLNGSNHEFRRLIGGAGISLAENANDVTIAGTYSAANAATGDAQVYKDTTGAPPTPTFNFRALDSLSANLTVANSWNHVLRSGLKGYLTDSL